MLSLSIWALSVPPFIVWRNLWLGCKWEPSVYATMYLLLSRKMVQAHPSWVSSRASVASLVAQPDDIDEEVQGEMFQHLITYSQPMQVRCKPAGTTYQLKCILVKCLSPNLDIADYYLEQEIACNIMNTPSLRQSTQRWRGNLCIIAVHLCMPIIFVTYPG